MARLGVCPKGRKLSNLEGINQTANGTVAAKPDAEVSRTSTVTKILSADHSCPAGQGGNGGFFVVFVLPEV